MISRWARRSAVALLFVVLAALLATRIGGLLLKNADGRALGYSQATQEWLALEYPSHAPAIDGPYVRGTGDRRRALRLERTANGAIGLREEALPGAEVEVELDEAQPRRFRVALRDEHPRAPPSWPMPARMLVASDFEGEFDAFVTLLQAHGVIDAQWHWQFGEGHLVLVSDMVDRGRNVVPLLWLVYRLEAEAQAAGGALHYVLGNHEQKLLNGRTSDVHPKYYGSFRLTGQAPLAMWDEDSELGRWLRSKPVLLRVGDYLFMHGGVSPEVLALQPSLDEADRHAAAFFARPPEEVPDARARALLWERTGLLWYRGLAMALEGMPRADAAHVDRVLRHFEVNHLAIGHTLARQVGQDYDGKVLRIDVHHASGTVEAVLVEGDARYRIDARGNRHPLPAAVNLE